MSLKLLVLGGLALLGSAQALAQDCSITAFRGKALALAQEAYPQLVSFRSDLSFTRQELVDRRNKERTCTGQASFDVLLAMLDVQHGDLQTGINAMGTLLRTDDDAMSKHRMMNHLIERFVIAGEIRTAIRLQKLAIEKLPDHADSYTNDLILLLTGVGEYEAARQLADERLSESFVDARKDRIPYTGWLRLAISEVSGDAGDEAEVTSRLTEYFGSETEALIARDRAFSGYTMLLRRAFDPSARSGPLTPPTPRYPRAMAYAGKEGLCDVRFDLSYEGVPENVEAVCSNDGFAEESIRAVSAVRFEPLVVDGVPHRVYNVVYPLEYNIR